MSKKARRPPTKRALTLEEIRSADDGADPERNAEQVEAFRVGWMTRVALDAFHREATLAARSLPKVVGRRQRKEAARRRGQQITETREQLRRRIAKLDRQGLNVKQIAKTTGVSERTVYRHRPKRTR